MPKLAGVNHLDAVRALAKSGFQIARQGKHISMTDGNRVINDPASRADHPLGGLALMP
ncbi:MAG: hypothetical protein M3495_21790 [Pseudomonadota bacterium]|nr:hypothetical protein [Pseudomonadota bacterium]